MEAAYIAHLDWQKARGHPASSMRCARHCMAHGGAAPQVRQEATIRRFEESVRKAFGIAYARWLEECTEWQVQRIVTTATLLGIPPEEVTPADIGFCRGFHGVPGGEETRPKIRVDRRYGPRVPRRGAPQVKASG
jgi:hypothetical protein